MYCKIKVFPNLDDKNLAEFSLQAQISGDGPLIDHFRLDLGGYVPTSDSVAELRARGLEQAKFLLTKILAGLPRC
jgi:hypothetical protein